MSCSTHGSKIDRIQVDYCRTTTVYPRTAKERAHWQSFTRSHSEHLILDRFSGTLELQFELAPGCSVTHKYQLKDRTPGSFFRRSSVCGQLSPNGIGCRANRRGRIPCTGSKAFDRVSDYHPIPRKSGAKDFRLLRQKSPPCRLSPVHAAYFFTDSGVQLRRDDFP